MLTLSRRGCFCVNKRVPQANELTAISEGLTSSSQPDPGEDHLLRANIDTSKDIFFF